MNTSITSVYQWLVNNRPFVFYVLDRKAYTCKNGECLNYTIRIELLETNEKTALNQMSTSPKLIIFLIGGLIFAGLCMIRMAGFLQPVELASYDLLVRNQHIQDTNTSPVIVVQITEEDIEKLGHWPLSDAKLASVLEKLITFKPRVIGVDLYRDIPVLEGRDYFNQVLTENPNIYFIEKFGNSISSRISPPGILVDTGRTGFADVSIDPGGVVRKGLLFLDNGEQVFYSFPLVLSLAYLQKDGIFPQSSTINPEYLQLGKETIIPFESNTGGYVNSDASGYQFMLNFSGGASPFQLYSLQDVENGTIDTELFNNSVVLLGVVADSVKDYFESPFSTTGDYSPAMPGVVLHAHTVSQLINMAKSYEKQLSVWNDSWEFLWIGVWIFAGVIIALITGVAWPLLIYVLIGTGVIIYAAYASFSEGLWLPASPALLAWLVSIMAVVTYLSAVERAQRRQLMDLFSKNVSTEIANEIWRQKEKFLSGGRLSSVETVATVLFSDLEDFTPVSEKLDPSRLMEWLNRYMAMMTNIVISYNGIVDDYYGDAIKANFGVPIASLDEEKIVKNAKLAALCALAMREAISRLNKESALEGLPPVRMRIGIFTGEVVAGFIGSSQRMKYTTVGDSVNTAARLESYGKEISESNYNEQGCRILISESTKKYLQDDFEMDEVGELKLKGKDEAVNVYRLNCTVNKQTNT